MKTPNSVAKTNETDVQDMERFISHTSPLHLAERGDAFQDAAVCLWYYYSPAARSLSAHASNSHPFHGLRNRSQLRYTHSLLPLNTVKNPSSLVFYLDIHSAYPTLVRINKAFQTRCIRVIFETCRPTWRMSKTPFQDGISV